MSRRSATWRLRRHLVAIAKRLWRWEFWPAWVFYIPIAGYYLWLALRYRSFTLPCLANPGLPLGGWFESKAEILAHLRKHFPENTGQIRVLPASSSCAERLREVMKFQEHLTQPWPVVVKPDFGERGRDVVIADSKADLQPVLENSRESLVLQQFHEGIEFGVFLIRMPKEKSGTLFSITEKKPLTVTGDGIETLETLILSDDRAVCKARDLFRRFPDFRTRIPAAGETVRLTALGSHKQGTLFIDHTSSATPELAAALTAIADALPGFHFGRFDIKAPSLNALLRAESLKILELNGVTSEPIHIFEPYHSLRRGYRTMFELWRIAFAIGAFHRRAGLQPPSWRELLGTSWKHFFDRRRFSLVELALHRRRSGVP